jgi:hypothetical protein
MNAPTLAYQFLAPAMRTDFAAYKHARAMRDAATDDYEAQRWDARSLDLQGGMIERLVMATGLTAEQLREVMG